MCVVIDTNNISRVFDPSNAEHADFAPVFQWIVEGNGKVVVGGSKFDQELLYHKKFIPFLGQLSRMNKVLRIPTKSVDDLEAEIIRKTEPHQDFDDPHIVSLLALSGCKIICSSDVRGYPYFTNSPFYHKKHKPKIYSSSRNSDLLIDRNICDLCRPISKLKKEQLSVLTQITNAKAK
jgi:hypothetical protein